MRQEGKVRCLILGGMSKEWLTSEARIDPYQRLKALQDCSQGILLPDPV